MCSGYRIQKIPVLLRARNIRKNQISGVLDNLTHFFFRTTVIRIAHVSISRALRDVRVRRVVAEREAVEREIKREKKRKKYIQHA